MFHIAGNRELYQRDLELLGKDGQLNIIVDDYNAVVRMVEGWHLCGYVEVPENIDINDIECHGGITFDETNVNGYPTDGRYIGFDCAHGWDWTTVSPYGEYRNIDYVKNEIKYIIKQLTEVKNEH